MHGRSRSRPFSPSAEHLERRALLSTAADLGQWPLRNNDLASSVLVRFRDSALAPDRQSAINAVQGYVTSDISDGPSLLSLGQGVDPSEAIAALRANPNVSYAVQNRLIGLDMVPNDPSYPSQWALNQTNNVDINAPEAWDVTTGSASTLVAVIDTGLDVNHPEFAGRLWVNPTANTDGYIGDTNGYNFGDNNSNLQDVVGHGTHVSGIIGATGNNTQGVAGVNWNAKFMVLKYYGANGGYLSSAVQAIYFAADHGARVINASWGTPVADPALASAINYANSKGTVFVSAAGNSSTNIDTSPFYPASFRGPNTITVASIDSNGSLSSFSNYGLTSVDIAAPGGSIYSTVPGGYGTMSGTSMAAPFVTGVVSLIAGQHPDWTPAQIVQRVLANTKPIASLTGKIVTGGIVDAAAAVGYVAPPPPSVQYLDDSSGTSTYSETGSWSSWSESASYNGGFRYAPTVVSGTATATANWTTTVTAGATYRVSATWTAWTNRSADANFTVLDGTTSLGSTKLSQLVAPVGVTDAGKTWQDLGTFTMTTSTLQVLLGNNSATSGRYVIADAIRIERLS
jgi:subtilisin family serine protease